ncbi:GNAT family N-acetyltransferase [Candidatus Woesebacteria bacterium]|nr:GNAT family N-acetyltransferase [Candidatus Woesebacteria bacterium]
MLEIKTLTNKETAVKIAAFLTGPNAFDQTWAPNEKKIVEKAVIESLDSNRHQYWYIEDEGKIIAAMGVRENKYGSGGYEMDEDYFAVHKQYRHQGLASRLLSHLERFVKKIGGRYIHALSCDIDSYAPARAFYKKSGYKQVAAIPDYYVEGGR